MKHLLRSIVCLLALSIGTVFVSADNGPTIISYQSQPQQIVQSDFIQRLLALPEWEPFYNEFTTACDKALKKELGNREKLERSLPKQVVDEIQSKIGEISTRKGIDEFFRHVEAIVFRLKADSDKEDIDENLDDIAKLLSGREKDIELDFDGVCAFILDVDPRGWPKKCLTGFREGRDYKYLRNDSEGFILDFDFEIRDREISFCCAGLKIDGDKPRYALIFSDDDKIRRYFDTFKSGAPLNDLSAKPLEQLVLQETCFLFLEHQRKRNDWKVDTSEVFSKIKSLKINYKDVDGISRVEAIAQTRSAEDAKSLRDIVAGLVALVKFTQGSSDKEDAKQVVQFIQTINIDAKDTETSVVVKLDQEDLWKLIAKGLRKATEEIKMKNQ